MVLITAGIYLLFNSSPRKYAKRTAAAAETIDIMLAKRDAVKKRSPSESREISALIGTRCLIHENRIERRESQ